MEDTQPVNTDDNLQLDDLRRQIAEFLGFEISPPTSEIIVETEAKEPGCRRLRIRYLSHEGDQIPAFLLLPEGEGPFPAVLVHHQHNSQRHLGKSEVCGLAGDPLQAFGPELVRKGFVVLAPDSICFEDRRRNRTGTEAHKADVAQHYNEMCYRLLRGTTLMQKVLSDSALAISLLQEHPLVDAARLGILGHSYGGSTVLFHAALDERIRFACSSGAACSFARRMAEQSGIEMASVIPGFTQHFDVPDLVACFTPRPTLIVSATADRLSRDAGEIVQVAANKCAAAGVKPRIDHYHYSGEHALTAERFGDIVQWLCYRGN